MTKSHFLFTLAVTCILLGACQGKKPGSFTIHGSFVNADKLPVAEGAVSKVYLIQIPFEKDMPSMVLDSAKIPAKSGSFSLTTHASRQQLMEVVFGEQVIAVPLVNDSPEVRLKVDLGKKDDFYELEGSQASKDLRDLLLIFGRKNYEAERSQMKLDSLSRAGAPDSVMFAADQGARHALEDLNTYLREFVNTNPSPVVCGLAMNWAARSFSMAESASMLNMLIKKFPADPALADLKFRMDQQLAALQKQSGPGESIWTGKQAPDLSLPDANGREISISSFRGKYLLVDFWASWCQPCRMENPNVVKVYSQFKDKNFAILGVSLDKEKDPWQEAIRQDRLNWTQVSDLMQWNSKAVSTFKFEGIPYNVLIDPQGKVIGEGLRGQALAARLGQVLK